MLHFEQYCQFMVNLDDDDNKLSAKKITINKHKTKERSVVFANTSDNCVK